MARKLFYKYDFEKEQKSLSQAKCHLSLTVLYIHSERESVSKWHLAVGFNVLIWALKFEPICNEFLLSRFLNNFRKNCVGVWNVKRNIVQVGINTLMARNHLIRRDYTLNKFC